MAELSQATQGTGVPFLEYYPAPRSRPSQLIVVDSSPFLIGRTIAANFVLSDHQVSNKHAVIERIGDQFRVRDLGSTNGTFVNGTRVTQVLLAPGDILHVAREEFRFDYPKPQAAGDSVFLRTVPLQDASPKSIIRGGQQMAEMLKQQAVRVIFQPIVCMETREPLGYESLARGTMSDMSIKPMELLKLAEQHGLAGPLSRLFREAAVQDAGNLLPGKLLFLNLHPMELEERDLLNSLWDLQKRLSPERSVVIEIPETAITNIATIRRLRDQLKSHGFLVAYDDFGAGQSRFMELTEVPPDFIKLDMQLIRNIHESGVRQHLIGALIRVGAELNVQIIAEGVETREEAQVCHALGCQYGQGYWFGRPTAVGHLAQETTHAIDLTPLLSKLKSSVIG